MGVELIASDVVIEIDGEVYYVDIFVNELGNLEIGGLPNVKYEMWGNELVLTKAD